MVITELPNEVDVYAFQVAAADLGPLIVGRLALRPNELSPLAELLADYRPGGDPGESRELASEREVAEACEILARPTLCLRHRTGGGQIPASELAVCNVHGQSKFVTIAPSTLPSNCAR